MCLDLNPALNVEGVKYACPCPGVVGMYTDVWSQGRTLELAGRVWWSAECWVTDVFICYGMHLTTIGPLFCFS